MMLTLLAATALAGQVHQQEVSLDELVAQSTLIVLVRPADPAWTSERVPVSKTADCGEYPVSWYHLHVKEVLKGHGADAPAGKISVAGPHASAMLEVSRRACEEGVRKSPIHPHYTTDASIRAGQDVIVFLRPSEEWGWQIAVSDGWEEAKRRNKVLKAIRKGS